MKNSSILTEWLVAQNHFECFYFMKWSSFFNTTRCSNTLVMKLYFLSIKEKKSHKHSRGKSQGSCTEQFKCKFFSEQLIRWLALKPLICLSWFCKNFGSDIFVLWGKKHFLFLLLWFLLESMKQRLLLKWKHLTWLFLPISFLKLLAVRQFSQNTI